MKKQTIVFIFILSISAGRLGAQCVSALSPQTICRGSSTTGLGGALIGGATTAVWNSGAFAGVFSNPNDLNSTWTPPTGYSGNATLTLTATDGGSCVGTFANVLITVTPNNTITLSSGAGTTNQTVCRNSPIANITYTTTGATGATFSGLPAGVNGSWASNVVTISGTPSVSGSFNYTVTLTGGCGNVTATGSINVTPLPVATFSYPASPFCSNGSDPFPTFSGGGVAGTFSSTSGLVFLSTSTGQVDLTASTPGTYTVTNTVAAGGGCGQVTATSQIIITPQPSASVIYTGSPWCGSAGVQNVTIIGTTGGTFSALPAGLTINSSTGAITPATSSAATYTVFYNIPAAGGCVSYTTGTSVTISPTPTAPVVGAITQPGCAPSTGSVVLSGLPAGNWTITRTPGGVITPGSGSSTIITNLPSGTFTFTVTNASLCTSPASANVVINAAISPPAVPVHTVDCALGFGRATVTISSPLGTGLEYSLVGSIATYPYQPSPIFLNVANDSYVITVRNSSGCERTGTPFTVSCGCVNGPTVLLSSLTGATCGITPVTVAGNSFGGSATNVTIASNGAGILNPLSSAVSPFSFTYTPNVTDGGKIVLITVTTDNIQGPPCAPGVAIYTLTVHALPVAPVIGTITQPTCSLGTGSVNLSGLPSIGTWTLTRNPGAIITTGNGPATTVTGLATGTYNFIVTSAEGCISLPSSDVVISTPPSAPLPPVIGTITQPTCAISTGGVALSGLPDTGNWTLTRSPGGVTISGTGTSYTVSALPAGTTYTFSVTNSTGCISSPSGNVVINAQPSIPPAPSVGTITPPTCILATGSVLLSGLPPTGTWTLIRYPGTVSITGTGVSSTISGLSTGSYNFTVTTADGCLSTPSANVVIPGQPSTPSAPVIGTITQPTLAVPTGSVVLTGLPVSGTWIITRLPGAVTVTGTGSTRTITNLAGGVFTFTVTNAAGCTSAESSPVTISTPGAPNLVITDPVPVCSPATINLTASEITTGSTPGLTYTYWTDAGATIPYNTPAAATAGIYYIKGTTVSGYFNIKPVTVTIDQRPVPNAGADQSLDYQFTTILDGVLEVNQTGTWSILTGTGDFTDVTDPKSTVTGLSQGDNSLLWTVKSGVCPEVFDTLNIVVQNLIIPTLITPNMDGRNDYFVIRGLASLGKTELIIFDRRGAEVYRNKDYDNSWNGVDYNKKPLPDDTYFYILKSESGKSLRGYIVIRH
jgi:gliding motility-associated-like protein